MAQYHGASSFPARQEDRDGRAWSVAVEIPRIDFTGPGLSSSLPVGPCQHIYRFAFPEVQGQAGGARPFRYVEVDWNTEGRPRGPNGSFSSAHFDFHFYVQTKVAVDTHMHCVSANGKTCDALAEDYAQMRRFLQMPDAMYVPDQYRADIDSSIPEMGLHLLDMSFDYTVDRVDHAPILIYGTFAGDVVFAEASVTLHTLQDAMKAPDRQITFPFRQPRAFKTATDWPTSFTVEYLPASGGFKVSFGAMVRHEPSPAPGGSVPTAAP